METNTVELRQPLWGNTGLPETHRHAKPPQGTVGGHGNGLPAPTLQLSPAVTPLQVWPVSGRGLHSTHSPPPCRRSCCARQCAAPGTPAGRPLCPQVLRTRHNSYPAAGPCPCRRHRTPLRHVARRGLVCRPPPRHPTETGECPPIQKNPLVTQR